VMIVREHLRLATEHPNELNESLEPLVALLTDELAAASTAGALRPSDRRDAVLVLNVVLANLHALALGQLDEEPALAAERLWRFCADGLRPVPPEHEIRPREGDHR
jgi:hypothetical protein